MSREAKTLSLEATIRRGNSDERIALRRGAAVGGTGAINGAMFLRGLPEDFDIWEARGNEGWGFAGVLPYFRGMESDLDVADNYHGTSGPVTVQRCKDWQMHPSLRAFRDACLDCGFPWDPDANNPWTTGVGFTPFNLREVGEGVPHDDAATFYLSPDVRLRPNLQIRPRAKALRVLFKGSQAIGVEVAEGRSIRQIPADHIVLAAGAIGSPQILQVSGVGCADVLRAHGIAPVVDLPGVGMHLEDHPAFDISWAGRDTNVGTGLRIGAIALRFSSIHRNDIKVVMRSRQGRCIMRCSINRASCAGSVQVVSGDVEVPPKINLSYFRDPQDLDRAELAFRTCEALARANSLSQHLRSSDISRARDLSNRSALRRWLECGVSSNNHLAGTCKMACASDKHAVVDSCGSVYGAGGLTVADAAIMPSCVSANINASVMMVAERIAHMLLRGRA